MAVPLRGWGGKSRTIKEKNGFKIFFDGNFRHEARGGVG